MYSRSREVLALATQLLVLGHLNQRKLRLSDHFAKVTAVWHTRNVPFVAPVLPKAMCYQYLRRGNNSVSPSGPGFFSCVRVCLVFFKKKKAFLHNCT